jgi:hypothetical protein
LLLVGGRIAGGNLHQTVADSKVGQDTRAQQPNLCATTESAQQPHLAQRKKSDYSKEFPKDRRRIGLAFLRFGGLAVSNNLFAF